MTASIPGGGSLYVLRKPIHRETGNTTSAREADPDQCLGFDDVSFDVAQQCHTACLTTTWQKGARHGRTTRARRTRDSNDRNSRGKTLSRVWLAESVRRGSASCGRLSEVSVCVLNSPCFSFAKLGVREVS